jgi:hypothetical protein
MSDNFLQQDLDYLEGVYFQIQYRVDTRENMEPKDWGIHVNANNVYEEEERLLKRGWIAENPLTPNCYYLTVAGGNALDEDVTTPFDSAGE